MKSRVQFDVRPGGVLLLALLYFFGGRYVLGLFLEQPTAEALQTGIVFLRILSPFYFVVSAKLVADGILRGVSAMSRFMAATFTDLVLRVVLAFVLSAWTGDAIGIWCAWPIGWTIAMCLSIFFYRGRCKMWRMTEES